MTNSWDNLKVLSDSTRLRLLALLSKEELSVAELQEILGMGQSRISSQLALLRSACEAVADLVESLDDRDNLERILLKRRRVSEQYFNLIAGRLGKGYCPGRTWEAIGHLALRLVPAITVADLGAGEGLISQLIAHRAERVWCIDNSQKMVEVGTELANKNGLANLTYKLGDIEQVPLHDKSVDLAILSQALHHASHPQTAINEAFRILKPGGQLLLLDLKEHNFEQARELYGDLWLGFKESTLHGFLKKAGFQKVEVSVVSQEKTEPHFETLLASGIKTGK